MSGTLDFKLPLYSDGVATIIPSGGHTPRVMDLACEAAAIEKTPGARAFMHRARHFCFGYEASQSLHQLATLFETEDFVREQTAYLPHPFPDYTFTFWVGIDSEEIAELMIIVRDEAIFGDILGYLHVKGKAITLQKEEPAVRTLGEMWLGSFLAIINRPAAHTIARCGPPRTALRRGKRVHFYQASEITIDLDAVKRDRTLFNTGTGKMMPRYEYRAHLCHSGGQPGCEHEWISIGGVMVDGEWFPDKEHPRRNPNWECYHCGRRRWHRKAGQRGSAKIGYDIPTYRVKKGKDE